MAFIFVMIASLAAVGLAPGIGSTSSGGNRGAPIDDDEPLPVETPAVETFADGPLPVIDASKGHEAVITTDQGEIVIALNPDAPKAANSFAFLAGSGFYDDQVFFFVDREFVAQAGDPTCETTGENTCRGNGGPGYTLPLEATNEGHEQWAVVAPSTGVPDEVHGSQFRILFEADERLDGQETVFGKVVNEEGQQILAGLNNFVPCSVVDTAGCSEGADLSAALIIEKVIVRPA